MPEPKIFCGNVFEKFNGDVLDVRLEAAVLRQGVYTGQDRDGNPCQYVNVSVRKSQRGTWYVELDMYHKEHPAPPQGQAPQAPAAPPQRPAQQAATPQRETPPPFPAQKPAQPPPATGQPPAQPPADEAPWPQENDEPPLNDIEF